MIKYIKIKLFLTFFFVSSTCFAQKSIDPVYCTNIVNAIEKVENSKRFPFGIKSIPLKGDTEQERYEYAKRICFNTVRNNWLRFNNLDNKDKQKYHCYLDFLAERYCSEKVDSIGHKNWVKNIHKLIK